ncbi:MAG: carboxypeptidase regulatory-like domain-containing protein [Planctomycetota bacterium]|jgi:protocatechuate 3,4-dioxygenase beta subunit
MTTPEKIGIAVVILIVAILGYFLIDFLGTDSSGEGSDLDTLDSKQEEDAAPKILSDISGADEHRSPDEVIVREIVPPDREQLMGTARYSIIMGRTVNEKGQPVRDAKITLREGGNPLIPHLPARPLVDVEDVTDSEGRFELRGIQGGGEFTVVANHPEFAEATFSPLQVRAGTSVEIPDIVLGSGTLVKGKVTDQFNHPIAGAQVRILDPVQMAFQKAEERKPFMMILTDVNGNYRFENIAFKAFEVTASADGFATQRISGNVQFESAKEKIINFQLTKGSFIAGFVTDENGASIEGAKIEATLVKNKDFSSSGSVLSEKNGFFSVEGLADGSYTVRISKEEYSDEVKSGIKAGTNDMEVILKKRGGVAGVIRDWKTQEPVKEFKIRVMRRRAGGDKGPLRSTRISKKFETDDGAYHIMDLDPGHYALVVSAEGYADCTSDDVTVVRDYLIRNVDIYMNKGGEIRGRVVDGSGSPVEGAKVLLNDNNFQDNPLYHIFSAMAGPTDGPAKKETLSAADGTFHLKLIVPGAYQVAVEHEDYSSAAVNDVLVVLGQETTPPTGEVVLMRGAKLFGTVRDASGRPVPGATIVVTSTSAYMKQTVTDKEGQYLVRHLTPGEYTVSCQLNRLKGRDLGNVFKRLMIAEKSKVSVFLEEGGEHKADIHLIE